MGSTILWAPNANGINEGEEGRHQGRHFLFASWPPCCQCSAPLPRPHHHQLKQLKLWGPKQICPPVSCLQLVFCYLNEKFHSLIIYVDHLREERPPTVKGRGPLGSNSFLFPVRTLKFSLLLSLWKQPSRTLAPHSQHHVSVIFPLWNSSRNQSCYVPTPFITIINLVASWTPEAI